MPLAIVHPFQEGESGAGWPMNNEVIGECGFVMAAGLGRRGEWPTNAQLFLIGNSAPMADLHSGA